MAVYRARESFSFDRAGIPFTVRQGHLVEEGDPVMAGREHLFELADEHVARSAAGQVERATAAPGERRVVTRK